eukprot:8210046-Pyramimonas_sp.AAC.1
MGVRRRVPQHGGLLVVDTAVDDQRVEPAQARRGREAVTPARTVSWSSRRRGPTAVGARFAVMPPDRRLQAALH